MIKEKKKKNENICKIFSIFFENKDPNYDIHMRTGDPKYIVHQIAKLGGTEDYYSTDSLPTLLEAFSKISDVIQTNYASKYISKQEY